MSNNNGQNSSLLVPNNTPQVATDTAAAVMAVFGNNKWAGTTPDGAGNVIGVSTQSMTYDAESRMTSWTDSGTSPATAVTFGYDGEGRRVTKASGGLTTTYVYDPAGNLAAKYGGPAPAIGAMGTLYVTADHLGSTRLVTKGGAVVGCHDYLPFGEEIPAGMWGRAAGSCAGQSDTAVKFTGQERDAETGLDNFQARHMAGGQGRFLSPDPDGVGADPGDPQSWNGYAYVLNNPLIGMDPTGMCTGPDCDNGNDGNSGNGDLLLQFSWDVFRFTVDRYSQAVQQTVQKVANFVSAPRNPGCMAAAMAAGTAAGGAAGALGPAWGQPSF